MIKGIRWCVVFLCVLSVAQLSRADEPLPTDEDVLRWFSVVSDDEVKLHERYPIGLVGGERAILISATVSKRGWNYMSQTLLVKPESNEARLLEGTVVQSVTKALDLDSDGVSEVVVWTGGSGGGSEMGKRAVVHIDGWEPIILRSRDYTKNEGTWGRKVNTYYMSEFEWEFVDIDGDGVLDLNERRIVEEGRNKREPVVTKGLYRYVFKDGEFVRYVDYLQRAGS